jgi:signal transduction histidine kinase/CheY-like chemotaxis protein
MTAAVGLPKRTLKSKLLRVMLSIVAPLSIATLACVTWVHYQASLRDGAEVERLIRDGIAGKGRVLTASHALALHSLVTDNAFGDVRQLIAQAVGSDPDLVYGLFLSSEGIPWAYVSPNSREEANDPPDRERWHELAVPPSDLTAQAATERRAHLFGQEVLEFSAPVKDGNDVVGTVRYGFSTARMRAELLAAQHRGKASLTATLLLLAGIALANLVGGFLLIGGASTRISRPLATLTEAAHSIAEGNLAVRVAVQSDDELELLARAFNHMLEVNQRAFAELKETTERALEASRIKSEFLANMSHEIRTPMNGVMGVAKLMLDMPLDSNLRRYVEAIDVSSAALLTILNDVLDFSKMEAGKYVIQRVAFDPRMVVHEVVQLLGVRAYEKGLDIACRVDPELPPNVLGDPDRLRQVLSNLVGNALKFTEVGEVFVDVRMVEKQPSSAVLQIEVKDTGIGIAEKDLYNIFEAFSQLDGSMARKQGGTGLGLSIARRLVEMMGGSVQVSSNLGQGSTFGFTVRVDLEPSSEMPVRRPVQLPSSKRALVIEAHRKLAEAIEEHAKCWGLDCEILEDGEQSLSRVDQELREGRQFDLIVVGKPGKGLEVSQVIRSIRQRGALRKVPLVLLHEPGKSGVRTEVEQEIGARLPKPFRMSDLYNCFQSLLLGRTPSSGSSKVFTPQVASGIRVLVVDDNEINRLVAVEQLERAGFSVDVACDGREALDLIADGKYAMVLMDCQMPVMDGYSATRELRRRELLNGRHQIVIAVTAHALVGERERVLSAGMDDYVSKPLRADSLQRMVDRHLKSHALEALPSGEAATEVPPLANDVARSRTLVEMCLREMPKQLRAVDDALSRRDPASLRSAAHKLKGSSMAIAADGLIEITQEVQRLAEERRLNDADARVAALRACYAKVEAALRAELERPPSKVKVLEASS